MSTPSRGYIPEAGLYQGANFSDATNLELGKISDYRQGMQLLSMAAGGTIPFGYLVQRSAQDTVTVASSSSTPVVGVAAFSQFSSDIDNQQYLQYDSAQILDEGVIVVQVMEAVDPTYPVRAYIAAGVTHTNADPGMFGTTSESGKTILLEGARFIDTVTTSGVCRVELGGQANIRYSAD